jgi:hypothetical protein
MSVKQDAFDTSSIEEEEQPNVLQSTTTELSLPVSLKAEAACDALSVSVLAHHCLREIDKYRRGEPWTDEDGLELLCRATVQEDQKAWTWVLHCCSGLVHGWQRRHPMREVACRLESVENDVAQAFERFWQATTLTQRVEFNMLAATSQYLHASLNGAILDTLRTYARPEEVTLPDLGEPYMEDTTDSSEVWETLQTILSNEREQRLAYLLFHCDLKPREIIHFCQEEWSDVREIYRLRRNIMDRLLHNADQLRWRSASEAQVDIRFIHT